MAYITCPECQKQFGENEVSCPNCGFQLNQEIFKNKKKEQKENELNDSDSFTNILKRVKQKEKLSGDDRTRLFGFSIASVLIILTLVGMIIQQIENYKSSKENSNDIIKSSTNIPATQNLEKIDIELERENRRKEIDRINIESDRIAHVAIGDMPKGSINVDSLMLVYRNFAADSAELGLRYAKYLISLKNRIILEKEQKQDEIRWSKTKAGKIQKEHPEWSKNDCLRIANNEYWIGMSIEMLHCERGYPNSVNPSNYGAGVKYQWCWHGRIPSYFYGGDDGIITAYN